VLPVRPVEVDISTLEPGQMLRVEWRGKPVWVVRRTPEQLESLKKTDGPGRRPEVRPARRTPRPSTRKQPAPLDQAGVSSSALASARTWAARPRDKFQTGPQPSLPDDWAGWASSAPATAPPSTSPAACSSNMPAPDNLEVPPTLLHVRHAVCWSAKTRRPDAASRPGSSPRHALLQQIRSPRTRWLNSRTPRLARRWEKRS
jgi:hypothetical protein